MRVAAIDQGTTSTRCLVGQHGGEARQLHSYNINMQIEVTAPRLTRTPDHSRPELPDPVLLGAALRLARTRAAFRHTAPVAASWICRIRSIAPTIVALSTATSAGCRNRLRRQAGGQKHRHDRRGYDCKAAAVLQEFAPVFVASRLRAVNFFGHTCSPPRLM